MRATRVFVAGATGAVGLPLCRLLVANGFAVTGTTRDLAKAERLTAIGVTPAIVDVFDASRLTELVVAAEPFAVIHQLTDLPPALDPALLAAARLRNARIREEGTRNLIAAAKAAGAGRLVAQSLGFAYAPAALPIGEDSPIDLASTAVASLERQVLGAGVDAVVLRYGRFYGPGTGFDSNDKPAPLHVDAAAYAAFLALQRGGGIYNIAEDDGQLQIGKAKAELGWSPDFRLP